MSYRAILIVSVLAVATFAAPGPVLAAPPKTGSITGADMVGVTVGSACGVRMSATFADIGRGYVVDYRIHSQVYGTTIHVWQGLAVGQTSASKKLTVCSLGDTWDRLVVVLYRTRTVVDTERVVKTIACAPRPP